MTSESLEDRLRRLGDHLDAERATRSRIAPQTNPRGSADRKDRRSTIALMAAAALIAIVGTMTFWPEQESPVTTVTQSTVVTTSTGPSPTTSSTTTTTTAPEVDRRLTEAGRRCFEEFEPSLELFPDQLPFDFTFPGSFSETRLSSGPDGSSFVILHSSPETIICRDLGDRFEYVDFTAVADFVEDGSDVQLSLIHI